MLKRKSRVINVSSRAHKKGKIDLKDIKGTKAAYSLMGNYSNSKLANVLFAR